MLFLLIVFSFFFNEAFADGMVFVTVADKERYEMLNKSLASIVATNREHLSHIAVFDLGFTPSQRESLNNLEFVHVYDIEPVNPDIFKMFVVRTNGRKARGWYSWKPVILKQALDMFPVILYMDASTIVKNSLESFFAHIRQNGYLLISRGHDGRAMTTQAIIKKFQLDLPERAWILNRKAIEAGFQGLSRSVYSNYVCPMYELAKDIRNFEDDGSAPLGFGHARHDQTLFNIYACLLKLDVNPCNQFVLNISGKALSLRFDEYVDLKGLKRKGVKKA